MRLRCLLALGLCFSACCRVPPADDGFVSSAVENRIGATSEWRKDSCKDLEACSFIENALKSEMTPDLAIQIALLNNPKIQAIFEDKG